MPPKTSPGAPRAPRAPRVPKATRAPRTEGRSKRARRDESAREPTPAELCAAFRARLAELDEQAKRTTSVEQEVEITMEKIRVEALLRQM